MPRKLLSVIFVCVGLVSLDHATTVAQPTSPLWNRDNLVAWCIVPFDSEKRTPAQRVAMLKELGLKRFAYDHRPEHLPTFESEIELLIDNQIELTAVWFPTRMNEQATFILDLLKKHRQTPQLWVMGGGELAMTPEQTESFIAAEIARLRPIAEAAQAVGCKVALYNHGGWFGEPENQLKLIERLAMPNVGIVYNLHHGHSQLDRLPEILSKIRPHLLALNINGMRTDGDRIGHKILPIGEGDRDLEVLKQIEASGYQGLIGILNHTDEDAKQRLQDNLDGLQWSLQRNAGKSDLPKPHWRSYRGAAAFHPALPKQLVAQAEKEGDAGQGLRLFASAKTGCVACHAVGEYGGKVGPDLSSVGLKRSADHIVTSLLWPNREIDAAYQTHQLLLDDGRVITVFRTEADQSHWLIRDVATGLETKIARDEVEEAKLAGSPMPETLVASLPRSDQLHLIAFLTKLGQPDGLQPEIMASVLKHTKGHKPTAFPYTKAAISRERHPYADAHINRDRAYDFYTKQALHFRSLDTHAELLTDYPGLDGQEFGHWGNQDEKFWAGNESNSMSLPPFTSHVFKSKKQMITRGVCVRPNGDKHGTAVFNTDSLQFEACWPGTIAYSSVRHGFLDGVKPDTDEVEKLEFEELPGNKTYLGFYRFGAQTVFSYTVDEVEFLDSIEFVDGKPVRTRLPASEHPLHACKQGGARTDDAAIRTEIEIGSGSSFMVDTIKLPFDNPWKAPLFCGDLDFLSDGSVLLSTMIGDVWHVDGFQNPSSNQAVWRRFATGLHQPLGLVVHQDQCYVLGRNQITRLHDLNRDGQADWYECFSKAYESSPAGHDFICGLQRDSAGNFYTASGNQGLLRISPDGKQVEVLGKGCRNPDGLGLLPDGSLTIPCAEGDWTPASMICYRPAGQVGLPFFGHKGPAVGGRPELPLVYLPRGVDNSSGGQLFISSERWGAMQGSMLHFSHGTGTAMHLMIDKVGRQHQGAVSVLPVEFRSGVHRGRFSPLDGQLYVAGMNGWGSYAPDDGCLQRLRLGKSEAFRPIGFHLHENGIALTLPEGTSLVRPRARGEGQFAIQSAAKYESTASALKASDVFAQVWNYRYGPNYGSAEYSTFHRGVRGHDRLRVAGLHSLDGGKTLFVELPELQLCNQLHLHIDLGTAYPYELFATVNRLDGPRSDLPGYKPVNKVVGPHPIEQDLADALKRKPNPYRKKIKEAREIVLEAGQNLSYSTRTLHAKAGEAVALRFKNPDVVPHNWALLAPGSLSRVGELANRLISDPDAAVNNYIPDSKEVLFYTDIVEGTDETTIYFNAPDNPGRYPYLCTFPGHWMVMNGEMIVE